MNIHQYCQLDNMSLPSFADNISFKKILIAQALHYATVALVCDCSRANDNNDCKICTFTSEINWLCELFSDRRIFWETDRGKDFAYFCELDAYLEIIIRRVDGDSSFKRVIGVLQIIKTTLDNFISAYKHLHPM